MPRCGALRSDDTDARMMSHATTESSSSHHSTSGTGSGARSQGPLIKPYGLFTRGSVVGGESISLRASAVINQMSVFFTASVV
jgi:hypothetical protein